MTKITLRPGDYVRTEGMTEEQYHAVAKAFMEAGCPESARPLTKDTLRTSRYVGWGFIYGEGETFAHANTTGGLRLDGRELTIDQILGTEPEAPMTIEQLLTKANKHAAKAAKHESKRQALIEQARELMPEGWRLEDSGLVVQPAEDMTDPANWKAGDVVECIEESDCETFLAGQTYKLREDFNGGNIARVVADEHGKPNGFRVDCFRWISRPQ